VIVTWRVVPVAVALAACGGEGAGDRAPAAKAVTAPPSGAAGAFDAAPGQATGRASDRGAARRHNLAGDRLVRDGRLAEAVAAYEQALALDPGFAQAASNLAWTRFLLGNLDGAQRDAERALALAGDDPALAGAALYNLGRVAEQRNDLALAKRRYRESLRSRPHAGVAARLAGLDTDAERDEDAELLAAAQPPPPDRKLIDAPTLRDAIARCAVTEPIVIEDAYDLALARSHANDDRKGQLVAIARVAPGRFASLVLGPSGRAAITPGVQPNERVIVGDRIWFLRAERDGIRVLLEIPPGYSWRAAARDLVITPDEGTPPDPEGPEGRWRLVEGIYRKLEL
jgi:hypothetical protein